MLSDSSTIRDKNCVRLPLLSGPLSILIWMRLVSAFSRWIMVRRAVADGRDRKSTRLNSSHEWTSYAVFCLKKKIGESQEKRIAIKDNVVEIYRHRSGFIHHGRSIKDLDLLSTFMLNAWTCFNVLLVHLDRYQTKDQLIHVLEDRKMA